VPTEHGSWDTLVLDRPAPMSPMFAPSLHPDLSGTADTQDQRRTIDDDYLDTPSGPEALPATRPVAGRQLTAVAACSRIGRSHLRGATGACERLRVARYMGRRYLDEENTAPVGRLHDRGPRNVGYSWKKYRLSIDGTNLHKISGRPSLPANSAVNPSTLPPPRGMIWAARRICMAVRPSA